MKPAATLIRCLLAVSSLWLLSGCLKDHLTKTYSILTPVYKDKKEVLAQLNAPQPLSVEQPGKIYLYNQYIFLNEIDKGVHVIDNSNPSHPVNIAFIAIPGNRDIAVKGHYLYADFNTDLLCIDISNPAHSSLIKIVPNVFPERFWNYGIASVPGKVIVSWERRDTTVMISRADIEGSSWCRECVVLETFSSTSAGKSAPGIGGSMARMAIVGDYLYAVDRHTLTPVSLANPDNPGLLAPVNAGWDIETIYPFEDKLFLGSMGGMFVFDLTDPQKPQNLSMFDHARACDPVVANNQHAFVTLREGTGCGPSKNQLLVLDVTHIEHPWLIKDYEMSNPHGLAIDGNLLFICDGNAGLKIFDASDVRELQQIGRIPLADTYDVIAWNKKLIVVAKNGIWQFDYTDPQHIQLLSSIVKQ